MSAKLVVLYAPAADPAAFDEHYRDVHAPIVDTIPGLQRRSLAKFVGAADDGDVPYYQIAELTSPTRTRSRRPSARTRGRPPRPTTRRSPRPVRGCSSPSPTDRGRRVSDAAAGRDAGRVDRSLAAADRAARDTPNGPTCSRISATIDTAISAGRVRVDVEPGRAVDAGELLGGHARCGQPVATCSLRAADPSAPT